MNWDEIRGRWKQVKGRVKSTWGRLTRNDLEIIQGRRDILLGKLRETYGWAKAEASRRVVAFERRFEAALQDVADDATARLRKARRTATTRGRKVVTRGIDRATAGVGRVQRRAKKTAARSSRRR